MLKFASSNDTIRIMRRFYSIFILVLVGTLALMAGVREDFKANPKLSANNYQA